jgi:putative membrane protein
MFAGPLGRACLGTQGEPWDAQKDMALAALGTNITTLSVAIREWHPDAGG